MKNNYLPLCLDDAVPQEIEEYIEEILSNEFNTVCEDGSLEEIGRSLHKYHLLAKTGKEEELKKEIEKYRGSGASQSKIESNDSSEPGPEDNSQASDSGETSYLASKKKNQRNEPDEDGWITVSKGKK